MAILNALLASSAVAISLLAQTAVPVNALAAPAHAARNAITPNHNGMIKRKRNTHKHRKRCVAGNSATPSPSASATPDNSGNNNNNNNNNNSGGSTDNSGSNNSGSNNSGSNNSGSNNSGSNNSGGSNNNSGGTTYAPSPACTGGKVGLGWAYDLASNYIPNAITGRTCWYYNWSSWAADSSLTGGLKFVPMLWGGDHINDFQDNIINSATNYGVVLGMNEVNQDGQANIDPGTGASWWNQFIVPLRSRGYYLISPSTTSAPSGIQWMQQWLPQLGSGNHPDALALHWYGTSFTDFQNYVNSFAAAFPGYKLWITEFACTDFSGQGIWCDVPSFASQAAAWLDSNPVVEAYFPFGFVGSMSGVQAENRCMDPGSGQVTSVGWEYLQ